VKVHKKLLKVGGYVSAIVSSKIWLTAHRNPDEAEMLLKANRIENEKRKGTKN
jgi:hypothetical protein